MMENEFTGLAQAPDSVEENASSGECLVIGYLCRVRGWI